MARTNNLKAWREEAGLSQMELAAELGTTHVSIWRIESKGQRPRQDLMTAILQRFGYTSESDFYDVGSSEIAETAGIRKIPIIPYSLVSSWLEGDTSIDYGSEFEVTTRGYSARVFGVRNFGDAMLPTYKDGDIIFVDPDAMPGPNQCAVFVDGKRAYFRQYKERGQNQDGKDYYEAVTLRDGYASLRSDAHGIRIAGVEVECRSFQLPASVEDYPSYASTAPVKDHRGASAGRRSAKSRRQRVSKGKPHQSERNCVLCHA